MEQLKAVVGTGQLTIDWVIGPPRTCGNALHLSLAQAMEVTGQLNEPFETLSHGQRKYVLYADKQANSERLDELFEIGCRHIVEKYKQLVGGRERVHLIVHDLSQSLSEDDFAKIAEIGSHVIFTVRDPKQQALSMLKRYTNDNWAQPGFDKLNTELVLKLMQADTSLTEFVSTHHELISESLREKSEEELQKHRTATLNLAIEEIEASWGNLGQFVEMRSDSFPSMLLDYSTLMDNTEDQINVLADHLGVTFTPDMVNKWTRHVGDDFDCVITRNWPTDLAKHNTWNGPARNSTGFALQQGHASQNIETEKFPPEIQNALVGVTAIYEKIHSLMEGRVA